MKLERQCCRYFLATIPGSEGEDGKCHIISEDIRLPGASAKLSEVQ